MPHELTITSCQAANTFAFTKTLADYLTANLGAKWDVALRYISMDETTASTWESFYEMAASGEVDLAWICPAVYAQRASNPQCDIDLLATPHFAADIYGGQPVYYSHFIVSADSPHHSCADLRGATFAYNETVSHSGHNIVCAHLHKLGFERGFFAEAVTSGGHVKSIHMVADGHADCASIDSSVWLWYQTERPDVCIKLRVVEVLGPYAAPPLIISRNVPDGLSAEIRDLLLNLSGSADGRALLELGGLARFTLIDDAAYGPALEAVRLGESVRLVQ